jgi:hypothetical protein
MDSYVPSFDFDCIRSDGPSKDRHQALQSVPMPSSTTSAYLVFLLAVVVVGRHFSDHDFSTILTLGAGLQALGFALLSSHLSKKQALSGISRKTLQMYVLVYVLRLTSTLVKNGYLPVDQSGDWVYQAGDIISCIIVVQLLHRMKRANIEQPHDSMRIETMIVPCAILGMLIHADLNNSAFFDRIWTISMNLDTLAMAPQLWLMSKVGGEIDSFTSHFVALLFLSKCCSFAFWFYGYPELAPMGGGLNLAGWWIVACHGFQLILSGDFMYYYVKSTVDQQKMVLPVFEV